MGAKDGGFILLTALWLLLLAGAIAALMLAASLSRSRALHGAMEDAQVRHDLDSALATIWADRMFRGGASEWARLPASGELNLSGRRVRVEISDEASRIDVQNAAPDLIARTIRSEGEAWGLSVEARDALLASLFAQRGSAERLRSAAQLRGLAGDAPEWSVTNSALTIATAMPVPRAASPGAPGYGAAVTGPTGASMTDMVRIRISRTGARMDQSITWIARVGSGRDQPLSVIDRWSDPVR